MTVMNGRTEGNAKSESNQANQTDQKSDSKKPATDEQWGYDLYPERRGSKFVPSWGKWLLGVEGREELDRAQCERNVYSCVLNNPLVKLMMAALNSSGCRLDIRRHISCEVCDYTVSGGYDQKMNQIIVCQNTARNPGVVGGVLTHEMIHMFDYCRNELDFQNLDHLACTEIRAANLTHCSFISGLFDGSVTLTNIRAQHQACVKQKAISSVLAARNVTEPEARAAIERVFPRCYPDMEPIGRRIRRNSGDMTKAYLEAPLYGYES